MASSRHHRVQERHLVAIISALDGIEDLAPQEQAALDELRRLVDAPVRTVAPGRGLSSRPKPDPPELRAAKIVVRERSQGRCEARTPDCTGVAIAAHHRAGRGFAGCHDPLLLLDLCPGCHPWIHAHPKASYEAGWMLHRHQALDVLLAEAAEYFTLTAQG